MLEFALLAHIYMSTFGIILIPAASQLTKYNNIIHSLSKKYSTPDFEAHITILTQLEAKEKDFTTTVGQIVKDFKKIKVSFLGMNFSSTIHHCVLAQIKMSPQLLTLHNELASKLKDPDKTPYFPHMSLMYGNLTPEKRLYISNQVKLGKYLLLDQIVVVHADGDLPSDWTEVAKFKLN